MVMSAELGILGAAGVMPAVVVKSVVGVLEAVTEGVLRARTSSPAVSNGVAAKLMTVRINNNIRSRYIVNMLSLGEVEDERRKLEVLDRASGGRAL